MPNHCVSTLYITGKPKQLNKLMKQVQITESEATEAHPASPFSFHKIIPMPVDEERNWYNWSINNWGTKWDMCDPYITDDWEQGSVHINFWTAWSPVHYVLLQLSKDNPKVKMTYKYYDEGGAFYGTYTYANGQDFLEEEGDEWTCEIYDKYWGEESEHHSCMSCSEWLPCYKENTPSICSECQLEQDEQEAGLWDTEETSV
jgi:hypothetical protein